MPEQHIFVRQNPTSPNTKAIEAIFERKSPEEMREALEVILQMASAGQSVDHLVIHVIKNASTTTDHRLKKLLHLFWPLVDCYTGGQLKPHVILMSNSILSDLKHPNEHILCSALRCVGTLRAREVLQNLVPALPPLLSHSDVAVRSTTAATIHTLCQYYGDILPLTVICEALLEEEHPTVLRRLMRLLVDVDPANASLYAIKLLQKMGLGEAGSYIFELLPTLIRKLDVDRVGLISHLYEATTKSLNVLDTATQYAAGLGFWEVAQAYHGINFIDKDALPGVEPVPCNDLVRIAIKALLLSSKNLGEVCLQTVLKNLSLAVRLFPGALVGEQGVQQVAVALCTGHLTDSAQLDVLKSEIFRNLALLGGAQHVCEILANSSFFQTQCLQVVHGAAREVCYLLTHHSVTDLSFLPLIFEHIETFRASYYVLDKLGTDYKQSLWEDTCCSLITATRRCPLGEEEKGRLVLLLLQIAVTHRTSSGGWSCELLRSIISTLEDISTLATVSLCLSILNDDEKLGEFSPFYGVIRNLTNGRQFSLSSRDVLDGEDIYLGTLACYGFPRFIQECSLDDRTRVGSYILICAAKFYKQVEASPNACKSDACTLNELIRSICDALKGETPTPTPMPQRPTTEIVSRGKAADECTTFSIFGPSVSSSQRSTGTVHSSQPKLRTPLGNVVQLTGDSEFIYAEAIIDVQQNAITLDVLFINRQDAPAHDVHIELFATSSVRVPRVQHGLNLEPRGTGRDRYVLYVDNCENGTIFGNICGRYQQKKERDGARHRDFVLRTQEIHIDICSFLSPHVLSLGEFRRLWPVLDWEARLTISTPASIDVLVERLVRDVHAFPLQEEMHLNGSSLPLCCRNFAVGARSGIVLMNLTLERGDQRTVGSLKLRSWTQALGSSLGSCLGQLLTVR
ncbi:Coatomer beta subunit [Giardia muris]|uniref:Coatomer beta subunit n=1 Tax=Giardia muris TaxID=5742 RepID=A0A4Z1T5P6_GIAMU|nr:Coatomer beta subunit [Giardia muris]|eukprot:TNJ28457.1 Coatomer beta subunit [Giardia muris]